MHVYLKWDVLNNKAIQEKGVLSLAKTLIIRENTSTKNSTSTMKDSTVPLILGLIIFSAISLTIMGRVSEEVNTASVIPANTQQIRGIEFDSGANLEQAHTSAPEFSNKNEFFERFFAHKQEMILFAGDLAIHPTIPEGVNLQTSVDKTDEILAKMNEQYATFAEGELRSEEILSSFTAISEKSKVELTESLEQHYAISDQMITEVRVAGQVEGVFLDEIARLEGEEKQILLDIINQMP